MTSKEIFVIEGVESSITVTYTKHPGSRGCRDSYGVPMEPDEEPHVEIESIIDDATRKELELSPEQLIKLERQLWRCDDHE